MKPDDPLASLEDKLFLYLVVAVTLAFAWILAPFHGAVFWGVVLAILFAPIYRRFLRLLSQNRNLAAFATLGVVLILVVFPVTVIIGMLLQEGANMITRIKSGELDFAEYFQRIFDALPGWISGLLDDYGLSNLRMVLERIAAGLLAGSQFLATQALNFGQNTFDFVIGLLVMSYLLFFLLRDGDDLARRILHAVPLHAERKRELFAKFIVVIRATVKGNIVVAIVQGALGGLIFWFMGIPAAVFWAVVMAFLSLLPAVGAALVWMPVAIYFIATGSIVQGAILIAYGVLVIGLVDNILRPILVGKDTKMPDYVVLISTLGGMALFGINGFVIGPVIAAMFIATWDIFVGVRTSAENRAGRR